MASSKRVQVFPTRMALTTWKGQKDGAQKGEMGSSIRWWWKLRSC